MPERSEREKREKLLAFLEAHWTELTLREASSLSVERLRERFGADEAAFFNDLLIID